jgi:S1-C subfamily serine protease
VRRGDVIRMINNREVGDMSDFEEMIDTLEPGKSVALLIWRDGATQFVAYTPETADDE